ncbi:tRNA-dihydrouridine synthase [Comamonas aquatilis]|uniref:oxidoreductase n=1 Tax=Comamonas aquatilis TaxID=1778406 RepID=UPI0039EF1868
MQQRPQRLEAVVATIKSVRASVGASVPVGIRVSQGKVNDFTHKWAEGEQGAETIFGTLAAAGVDYIHVTEFEAWQPAFGTHGPTLVQLARRYAKGPAIIANGGLHDASRALDVLEHGADIIALGRGALSNPDWPAKVQQGLALEEFDRSILGPIADIKASELAQAT